MRFSAGLLLCVVVPLTIRHASAQWPDPKAPVIPEADGYVVIPNAAVPPEKSRTYRAVFDATGVRLTSLPISCEKVYEGLRQKRGPI